MSIQIDPREVLEHLEYLGYRSITKEQLKEFIKDLKRLIKYEECKGKNTAKETAPNGDKVSVACETSFTVSGYQNPSPGGTYNVLSNNYERINSGNTFSAATHHSQNTSCQACEDRSLSERSYHPNDYIEDEMKCSECQNCCSSHKNFAAKVSSRTNSKKQQENEKPLLPPPSWKNLKSPLPRATAITRRRKLGPKIIRPGTKKPSKNDPVALYHYYQNQWAKRPLPGEDPRTDLRWAVRTRLAHQQQVSQRKPNNFDGHLQRRLHT